MEAGWEKVYSSDQSYQVEIVKALLTEQGITFFVMDRKDSSYIMGEIEVYVPENSSTEAQIILTENDFL